MKSPFFNYPLKAPFAYLLTTLNNANTAVIQRATRIIVGSQLAIVVPKFPTRSVNPVVKLSGIAIVQDPSIFSIHYTFINAKMKPIEEKG